MHATDFCRVRLADLPGLSRPPRHELVDQLVDLRLAADVDAARRLVEDQHVDVVMQKARERDLLLIAARKARDVLRRARRTNGQRFDPRARPRAAAATVRRKTRRPAPSAASASCCRRCSGSSRALRPCGSRSASPSRAATIPRASIGPACTPSFTRPALDGIEPEQPREAGACGQRQAARRCRRSRRGAASTTPARDALGREPAAPARFAETRAPRG